MLKNKKLISIIATLAFCLSFLAPALIAPAPAAAADMYTVVKSANVNPESASGIGAVVKVVLPDIAIASGSRVTVSLPSQWTMTGGGLNGRVVVGTTPNANQVTIVGTTTAGLLAEDDALVNVGNFGGNGATINISPNKSFDIQLQGVANESGANKFFYIYFNGINVNNMTGDLNVTFVGPRGSVFSTAQVNLGSSSRTGATSSSIKKVNSIVVPSGDVDLITIAELQASSIANGEDITLKILTKGFEWDPTCLAGAGAYASYGWDFADGTVPGNIQMLNRIGAAANTALSANGKELTYAVAYADTDEPGRISFGGLRVLVDDADAKAGDVVKVKISGADVTEATLEVAKYADYALSYEAGTSKEIIAGHEDQEVGAIKFIEGAPASFIAGRTIKLTLPTGVRVNTVGEFDVLNSGDIGTILAETNTDRDVITIQLENNAAESVDEAATFEFNELTLDVAPDFSGALEAKISGTAGLTGTVKLADVKPVVAISAASIKDVGLGQANQALAEITLTEGAAEALSEGDLVLALDDGYRWADEPTVKVTEGDLDIDELGVEVDDNELIITIDGTSSTASKVVISDVYLDAERIAPEGPIYVKVASEEGGSTALMDFDWADWNDNNGPKAQVGNCVTPASIIGHNATFYIGSTIMNVNGANIIMDVAPYIKAGRTYVPVRYLGDALGATTAWDAATKTVTVTKGDKTVVLVIGSKTAKVNGADVAMDVAPEITNGRTMLPARYVAEGLGFSVGWNAALQQVVIQ